MAKLTDLPVELLEAIFREFLPQSMQDGEYICTWWHNTDSRRTRSALYSLSMVCKAISRIALPLLYEQLLYGEDLQRIAPVDGVSNPASLRLGYTRYLVISLTSHKGGTTDLEALSASWQLSLAHCTLVKHIEVICTGSSSCTSSFLLGLAGLPGFKHLQSLTLSVGPSDNQHMVFQDVCHFSNLVGLDLDLGYGDISSIGRPSRPLEHLKDLHVSYILNTNELSACMALVVPERIRFLGFSMCDEEFPSDTFLGDLFGPHTWRDLEYLRLPKFTTLSPNCFTSRSAQLPALRRLFLFTDSFSLLQEGFSVLPEGSVFLDLTISDPEEFLGALALIARSPWLGENFASIDLDTDLVGDWFSHAFEDPLYEGERHTRTEFLIATRKAMLAALDMDLELGPDDLVTQMLAWRFVKD